MVDWAKVYQARVNKAMTRWLSYRQANNAMTALAELLDNPLEDTLEQEAIIRRAWLEVFEKRDPLNPQIWQVERPLLEGLLCRDRWRDLMVSPDRAHGFVMLCARHLWLSERVTRQVGLDGSVTADAVKVGLRTAFAQWLPSGLSAKDSNVFTRRDLGYVFFGEAWCTFVFDTASGNNLLANLVEGTRPEFLPGRLSLGLGQAAEPLPALGI